MPVANTAHAAPLAVHPLCLSRVLRGPEEVSPEIAVE
jgi:hypothetical protein